MRGRTVRDFRHARSRSTEFISRTHEVFHSRRLLVEPLVALGRILTFAPSLSFFACSHPLEHQLRDEQYGDILHLAVARQVGIIANQNGLRTSGALRHQELDDFGVRYRDATVLVSTHLLVDRFTVNSVLSQIPAHVCDLSIRHELHGCKLSARRST